MAIAKAKKNGHVDVVKLLIEKKRKVFRSIPKKIRTFIVAAGACYNRKVEELLLLFFPPHQDSLEVESR